LGLVLDYRFQLIRFPSAATVIERAAAEPKSPDVIFFGSSRTQTGIVVGEANRLLAEDTRRPAPITFSAAVAAGDSYSAEFIFERLLAQGTKPKWAVLEVSPEILGARPPFMGEHVRRQFTLEHLFTELPAMFKANSAWAYLESRFTPIYTHRRQLVRTIKDAIREQVPLVEASNPPPTAKPIAGAAVITDGFGEAVPTFAPPSNDPNADEILLAQSRAGSQRIVRRWLRNYRIGGPAPPALERTLARCQAEGIQVILMGIPACSAHRLEFRPEILTIYHEHISGLVQKYGCQFVDASEWMSDRQFGDTMHLRTETGGKAFTARFTREVLIPAMK